MPMRDSHESFWVYIMASSTGTLYIGMTNSIERRVFEHKQCVGDGFAAKYRCTRLVYFEEYADSRSAIDRETQIEEVEASEEDCAD